jgi:starch synthase
LKLLKDKKILVISSEVVPYLPQTEKAINSFSVSRKINDNGGMTRIFMPKYGIINERRHQLHEVIRLSGMNMIINDLYMPLIIKVASIPKERMQVYFIDNDEYFKRKDLLLDTNKRLLKDNDERMIFFTKGVIETVKKLNWAPDIIHLHGWFASLFPLYIRKLYEDDPIFEKCKIISSLYSKAFDGNLSKNLIEKIHFDGIEDDLSSISSPDFISLNDLMIRFSDSVILSSENIENEIKNSIKKHSKDSLSFKDSTSDEKLMDFLLNNIN